MQLVVVCPRGFLVGRAADAGSPLPPEACEALRSFASQRTLVLLDDEVPDAVERWGRDCDRESVQAFWTGRLGRQARPPSALPFRWLARRFGLPPADCTCVASAETWLQGARRAGWQTVVAPELPELVAGGRDGLAVLYELAGR